MAIDPITLKTSQKTSAAWGEAISKALQDWADNRPIYEVVTGLEGPTFRKPGSLSGGDPDGCCLAKRPETPPTIESLEDLIERIRNLANYLTFLQKNL